MKLDEMMGNSSDNIVYEQMLNILMNHASQDPDRNSVVGSALRMLEDFNTYAQRQIGGGEASPPRRKFSGMDRRQR